MSSAVTAPLAQAGDGLADLFTRERLLEVGADLVGSVATSVAIVVVAMLVLSLLKRLLHSSVERAKANDGGGLLQRVEDRTGIDVAHDDAPLDPVRRERRLDALGALLGSALVVVVWVVVAMMVLAEFGVSLAPLLASAGIVGLAIGFGAQDLVADVVSGLFILAEDQYGLGDIVDVGEASGVVEGTTLRSTRIRDLQGTLWHVPNGEIRRVGNKSQGWARSLIDVDVAYGTDTDHAAAVVLDVATTLAEDEVHGVDVLEPPEMWGVESLGADGVTLRLVVKVVPGQQFAVEREIRRRLKLRFDAEGIEIPFPQRTIWVRRGDGDRDDAGDLEPAEAT